MGPGPGDHHLLGITGREEASPATGNTSGQTRYPNIPLFYLPVTTKKFKTKNLCSVAAILFVSALKRPVYKVHPAEYPIFPNIRRVTVRSGGIRPKSVFVYIQEAGFVQPGIR